jgi:hypothetical protein
VLTTPLTHTIYFLCLIHLDPSLNFELANEATKIRIVDFPCLSIGSFEVASEASFLLDIYPSLKGDKYFIGSQ